MATKREVLEAAARGEGCLGKAADDEPVFVLRAQDMFAGRTIQYWASMVSAHAAVECTSERELRATQAKVRLAEDDAGTFEAWGRNHPTKVPD
jgi:hypothetical protein